MTVMLYCTLPPSKEGVVNSSHNMVSPILAISCALRFAPLVTRKWWRGALGYDILCPHSLCPCSTLKDAIRWNLWRIDCVGRVQGLQSAPWVVGQLMWPVVHLTFWAFGLLLFFKLNCLNLSQVREGFDTDIEASVSSLQGVVQACRSKLIASKTPGFESKGSFVWPGCPTTLSTDFVKAIHVKWSSWHHLTRFCRTGP